MDHMSPDMMNEIAGMPETMRKQMMKGRLEQLLALPDESRLAAMRGMITAIHDSKVKEGESHQNLLSYPPDFIGDPQHCA